MLYPVAPPSPLSSPPTLQPAAPPRLPRPEPLRIAADADLLCSAEGRPGPAHAFMRALQRCQVPAQLVLASHAEDWGRRLSALAEQGVRVSALLHDADTDHHALLEPFDLDLYLTDRLDRALQARRDGIPAGQVLDHPPQGEARDMLTVVFDFDGVMADHASQRVYDQQKLPAFLRHEAERAQVPMEPGPLQRLARKLSALQAPGNAAGVQVRLCVVTARGAESMQRLATTLRAWGIAPRTVCCLSGASKAEFIRRLGADIFFDDQRKHLEGLGNHTLAVHVPPLPEEVAEEAALLAA